MEPVLGNVQSNKAEEGMIGAGQRGLGYGNDGYTNVQGSGQSHTISEIPPEMEVIVHDVDEIKEVEKEGYTTEAGNVKAGDPSRATDDDDSKKADFSADFSSYFNKPKKSPADPDYEEPELGQNAFDNDVDGKPSKNSFATDFSEDLDKSLFKARRNIYKPLL